MINILLNRVLFFSLLLSSTQALAAGGGLPLDFILKKQIPHFLIFVFLIGFLITKKVVPMLKQKREDFVAHLQKAQEAKQKAEALKKDIESKISQLEKDREQTLAQAKSEAEALKAKILSEAKEISERLESDAKTTVQYELERAKQQLEAHLLATSIEEAKKDLKSKADKSELSQLQASFTDKIQVVR